MTNTINQLEMVRYINAIPETVFKLITTPEIFKQWWGPKDCTMNIRNARIAPDGVLLYNLQHDKDNTTLWYKLIFQEVTPPIHISFISSFSDETGNVLRAPFAAHWPLELYNDWRLEGINDSTKISIYCKPYGATPKEVKAFSADMEHLRSRLVTTLDRLEAYLAA